MGDVHLNREFYSKPLTFNPDRFGRKEDKQGSPLFLGWADGVLAAILAQVRCFISTVKFLTSSQV
jgi:hypothetical protein